MVYRGGRVCGSVGQEVMQQVKVNAFQQRPEVLGQELDQVSERRAERAHVVREGVQHADGQGSVVLALQPKADAAPGYIIVLLIPPVGPQWIAPILTLWTGMCPGHRLLELVHMQRIEVGIQAGMVHVRGAHVAPHGEVGHAHGQRMLCLHRMQLHVAVHVATAAHQPAAQAHPVLPRRSAHAARRPTVYCYWGKI